MFRLLRPLSLSFAADCRRHLHARTANINPWFVSQTVPSYPSDHPTEGLSSTETFDLPDDVPQYLKNLHSAMQTSPFLETSQLLVCKPLPLGDGPGLPRQRAHGTRRTRRQTFAGQGIEQSFSLWDWAVYAQVGVEPVIKPEDPFSIKIRSRKEQKIEERLKRF